MYTIVCALGLQAAMPAHAGMWSNFTNWFRTIPAESRRTAGIVTAGLVAAVGACFGVYTLWAKKKAVEARAKAEREKAIEEQQARAEQQAFYAQYQDVDRNSPSAPNGTMTAQAVQTVADSAQSAAIAIGDAVKSAAQQAPDVAAAALSGAGSMANAVVQGAPVVVAKVGTVTFTLFETGAYTVTAAWNYIKDTPLIAELRRKTYNSYVRDHYNERAKELNKVLAKEDYVEAHNRLESMKQLLQEDGQIGRFYTKINGLINEYNLKATNADGSLKITDRDFSICTHWMNEITKARNECKVIETRINAQLPQAEARNKRKTDAEHKQLASAAC